MDIPQQIPIKSIMTDTGLKWNGLKIFIFVPINGTNNPQEIAMVFNHHLQNMILRTSIPNIKDIYDSVKLINERILNNKQIIPELEYKEN